MRALPSWPSHLPKAPPPTAITLGVRISKYEFWGETNIQNTESLVLLLFFFNLLSQSRPLTRLFNPFTFHVNQGVLKAVLPLKALRNNLFHVSLLSYSCIQSSIFTCFPCMSSCCLPSVYVCFGQFYKDTSHKVQAYLVLLCFTLLRFGDTAFFTNWMLQATLHLASLSVAFFQKHLLTLCLCVTVW